MSTEARAQRRRPGAPSRPAAEDARVRRSEVRFRAVFEGAAIGMALVDMEGRPLVSNPALERLLGYSAAELARMRFTEFTHPEDVDADWALFEELIAGARDHYRLEKRYFRKDGGLVWGKLTVSLVRDADGRPEYAIGMVEDTTELKRAEAALRESNEQLLQAQKMEAIGRLAGGIAHDFNNLLTVILCTSELLLERLGAAERAQVEEVKEAAEKAASLTRQLLAFSRRQPLQATLLDVNELVTKTARILRRVLGKDVELVTRLEPVLPGVVVDPNQLEQVLMNFAVNARDAMPEGGRLTLQTGKVVHSRPVNTAWGNVPPGRYVSLTVADTGLGMDEETRLRCFDPFFTTKEPGRGTGLGLSTAFGIVRQSGGYLWVESEPGRGATFTAYLPQSRARRLDRPLAA